MGKLSRLISIIGCMLFSCTPIRKTDEVSVNLLETTSDSLYYSMFVDSISYLPLEDSDECLIGKVTDVIFSDQYVFVLDGKQQIVWTFDKEGKFVSSIDKRGRGPGEYMGLVQFEYDKKSNELLLLDGWSKAILHYSPEGTYLKRDDLDLYCSDFKIVNDGYVLSMLGGLDSLGGVFHYKLSEGKSQRLLKRSHNLSCNYDWEMVSYDGTIRLMAPPLENTLYECESVGRLVVKIPFRMYPLPSQDYENDDTVRHLPDFLRTNYWESSRWIYASFWCARYDLRVLLYDKVTGDTYVGKGLSNDMDGVSFIGMTSACDRNCFVFVTQKNGVDANPVLQILHLK